MADRFTETVINRTRRAIDILLRQQDSAESRVLEGPSLGSANIVTVKDASKMCVNDSVYFVNNYKISENNQIIDIDYETNQVMLRFNIPSEFNYSNNAILVTQAVLKLWGMYLVNGNGIMGQDSLNSFFRQEYRFWIEGWKDDEASETTSTSIAEVIVNPESFDGADLDC